MKNLKSILPNQELDTDPNAYNFHASGFKKLSNLFVAEGLERHTVIQFFTMMIKCLYIEAHPTELDWINRCISKQGIVDVDKFKKEFMIFQFAYYQRMENFKAVIFVNVYSFNYMVIESKEQLRKNLEHFNITMAWSWKQPQGNTYRLGLRG
jgi:hypothetical protein